MGIDVVRSILRVILYDKDGCLGPELRTADRFDQPAQCQVIIRHIGRWRRLAGCRALRVIVRKPQDLQARHLALGFKTFQLGNETVRAFLVRITESESAIPFIDVALQSFHPRDAGLLLGAVFVNKFSVTAITHFGLARAVPNISARWIRNWEIAFRRIRKF